MPSPQYILISLTTPPLAFLFFSPPRLSFITESGDRALQLLLQRLLSSASTLRHHLSAFALSSLFLSHDDFGEANDFTTSPPTSYATQRG